MSEFVLKPGEEGLGAATPFASEGSGDPGARGSGLGEPEKEDRRRRYPVPLTRDELGRWQALHDFATFGELEIVKVLLLGSEEAFVIEAAIVDPKKPATLLRSPFGPGERMSGLRLPRCLFGIDVRRAELVEPFAPWKPGEVVRFVVEGEVEGGALVCRRKGAA